MSSSVRHELTVLNPELRFAGGTFDELLGTVGAQAPEVLAKREILTQAAHTLLDSYYANGDFFRAEDNAIGLLLAAGLQAEAQATDNKTPARQEADRVIADSFARTLFGRYSLVYPWDDMRKASQLDPAARLAIHQKYTNPDLSQRLKQWLQTSETMQGVRQKMGIKSPQSCNILVLSMGKDFHTKCIGKAEGAPAHMTEYVTSLHERGKTFLKEQQADPSDSLPFAYACTLQGKTYVCIMEPTARILLEPEAVGFKDDGEHLAFILALLGHEFTHSQGNLKLVDPNFEEPSNFIGALLEEYRAEVFSGCKFGRAYPDVYNAITYIEAYSSGVDISAIMEAIPDAGNNKVTFYAALIKALGLVTAAKLAGLLPEDAISFQSPKSARTLYEALDNGNLGDEIIACMTDEQFAAFLTSRPADPDPLVAAEVRGYFQGIREAARILA